MVEKLVFEEVPGRTATDIRWQTDASSGLYYARLEAQAADGTRETKLPQTRHHPLTRYAIKRRTNKTLKKNCYISLCCFFLGLAFSGQALAQIPLSFYDYARPELKWYTIDTEHFSIIFHADDQGEGSGRTARVVARIAEDVYEPITSLYGHEPDTKVAIILKDYEDYSNGAAYFFDNKIEIWAPSLDAPLRGDHNWLRNVITHEFVHIIQVQKAMKANRRLPFLYFQLLDYENVRRPDVLYGYPNVIVTYPITTLNNPAWLAEGTAQYQRAWLNYDSWDSHRDMLLRTRMLEDEQLSLEDMGGFYSHNSLLRETVYNQGFAFTHYLAKRFGEASLMEISAALGEMGKLECRACDQSCDGYFRPAGLPGLGAGNAARVHGEYAAAATASCRRDHS